MSRSLHIGRRSGRRSCPVLGVTVALLLASTVSACTETKDVTDAGVEKTGSGELRTELDPLVERMPTLADAESADWMSGTLGGRAPGPSSYWIDAVVTLDEATLQEVLALPGLARADPPKVVSGLRSSVPDAEFQQSPEMDGYFSANEWHVESWLAAEQGEVVLLVVGGN